MKKTLLLIENWHPKAFTLLVLLFALTLSGYSQGVAINNTSAPANSPLSAHVVGMVVYNTTNGVDVTPGLYFNDGTKWIRTTLNNGTNNGDMQYWNGTVWVNILTGTPGQRLQVNASGIPTWAP